MTQIDLFKAVETNIPHSQSCLTLSLIQVDVAFTKIYPTEMQ